MSDSEAMPLESRRKKLSFDPTINAGHILTFMSLLAALVVGWAKLDTRLTTVELSLAWQQRASDAQNSVITEKLTDLRSDVKEVKRSVQGKQTP